MEKRTSNEYPSRAGFNLVDVVIQISNRRIYLDITVSVRFLWFLSIEKLRGFEYWPQRIVRKNYDKWESNLRLHQLVKSTDFELAVAFHRGTDLKLLRYCSTVLSC